MPEPATPLYRKEALTPRSRSLSGEVIVHAHVPTLIITLLILSAGLLAACILFLGQVQTPDGAISVFKWLTGRGSS